jgi:hypothetical protein
MRAGTHRPARRSRLKSWRGERCRKELFALNGLSSGINVRRGTRRRSAERFAPVLKRACAVLRRGLEERASSTGANGAVILLERCAEGAEMCGNGATGRERGTIIGRPRVSQSGPGRPLGRRYMCKHDASRHGWPSLWPLTSIRDGKGARRRGRPAKLYRPVRIGPRQPRGRTCRPVMLFGSYRHWLCPTVPAPKDVGQWDKRETITPQELVGRAVPKGALRIERVLVRP